MPRPQWHLPICKVEPACCEVQRKVLNLPNRASNYIFPLNISLVSQILSKAREIFGISKLATHKSLIALHHHCVVID